MGCLCHITRQRTEKYVPIVLTIGNYYKYMGRPVKIVSGQYWGTYGLSNHWSWRTVLPDGSLHKNKCSGYGGSNFIPITEKRSIKICKKEG